MHYVAYVTVILSDHFDAFNANQLIKTDSLS